MDSYIHSRILVLLCCLPAAQAAAPAVQQLDPAQLDHDYSSFELPDGFDREVLRELENTPLHNQLSDSGANLGRVLFYDKRLSRNERTSCASCHIQELAFADPFRFSRGFERKRTGRNSMSLANVAYYSNGRFFWDERGATLEEMVLMPIQDEIEMGMALEDLVQRLEQDAAYRWLFWRAYGDPEVTVDRLAFALAQFLRSMVSFNSKFDQGLARAGAVELDFPNFSELENLGKRVFLGTEHQDREASCASCHMRDTRTEAQARRWRMEGGQLTQRAMPVLFQGSAATNNGLDFGLEREDDGRGAITQDAADFGTFKVPSLRNVNLTGPYMHDGRFTSLTQVIEHYSSGIRPHPNLDPRLRTNQAGGWGQGPATPAPAAPAIPVTPASPRAVALGGVTVAVPVPVLAGPTHVLKVTRSRGGFDFTRKERRALVAFLRTLTDETFVSDPKFSNPFR